MRLFAALLGYLVGISAIVGVGIVGLMALQLSNKQTSRAPTVAVAPFNESVAKPFKQPMGGQKTARPDQKKRRVRVTHKPRHEAPTIDDAGRDAYGYAGEPRRRIDPNLFSIFGR